MVFVVAIILGFLGAWAFNPDSGVLVHDALLWLVLGIMAEVGPLVLLQKRELRVLGRARLGPGGGSVGR